MLQSYRLVLWPGPRSNLKISDNEYAPKHHEIDPNLNCKICGKSYKRFSSVKAHEEQHSAVKKYVCQFCNDSFSLLFILKAHIERKHPDEGKAKCSKCGLWFISPNSITGKCLDCNSNSNGGADDEPIANGTIICCEICGTHFKSKSGLQIHNKRVSCEKREKQFRKLNQAWAPQAGPGGDFYRCEVCSASFPFLKLLGQHMTTKHVDANNYKCDQCDKSFYYEASLSQHKSNAHSGTIFECSTCKKVYTTKQYLNIHLRIHEPNYVQKEVFCDICGARYLSNSALRVHRKSHAGDKVYVCETCGKRISSLSSFRNHLRIHSGEKPFQCQDCGKGFTANKYLAVHMRVHTKEKPFKCHQCNASFTQRGSLTIHLRIHTGDRPYTCHACEKSFRSKTLLRTHIKTHNKYRKQDSK